MQMELSKQEVLTLIREFKKHSHLWNVKHRWYFNRTKKNESWEEIAKILELSVDEVRRKMSSLLGSFRRERSKERKFMITNGGIHDFKSSWYAYDSLSFLLGNTERKKPNPTQEEHEINEFTIPKVEFSHENTVDLIETESLENNDEELVNYVNASQSNRKRRRVFEDEEDDPLNQHNSELKEQPVEREDSTNMFGKYLVQKLNQFDRKTKSILIYKINHLIFETEMDLYSNYPPSPGPRSSPMPQSRPFSLISTINSHLNSESARDIHEDEEYVENNY